MNVVPETLDAGVSKRNLIKNIKDLYGELKEHQKVMNYFLKHS